MENKRFEITETAGSVKGFYVVVDKETGVNSLLCELATHPDFPRLMADLEIYVNGIAGKQVQSANAIVDAVSARIMKQHNPGLTDPQLRQLIAAHIDDDSFCRYVIQQDISKIALDLR